MEKLCPGAKWIFRIRGHYSLRVTFVFLVLLFLAPLIKIIWDF